MIRTSHSPAPAPTPKPAQQQGATGREGAEKLAIEALGFVAADPELLPLDPGAERTGSLNSGAAIWLRREVNATERLAWRYSRGGFSQWERQDIDRRYDQLARRIDRDDRRYGYGYVPDYRR